MHHVASKLFHQDWIHQECKTTREALLMTDRGYQLKQKNMANHDKFNTIFIAVILE